MSDQTWWWCLDHERVEPAEGCANQNRLGPYPTREAAADALATAHERAEKWDDEDRKWREGGTS